ncbi:MAG TPA: glycosyltransferase family 4 protein [Actinomycetes bacterium]|nr:glycosyltransferase family 4 protein [Actinomycetes bacterium]
MRLLLVVAAMRPGGAERIVVQLAADAVRRGDAVTVASASGPWVEQVRAAGAQHELVPLDQRSAPATLRAAGRLAAVLRRFRPEVVHAQNVRATLAAALALARPGRRAALLTTLHGLAPADYPAAARLLRLAGGTVIACAPAVGRSLLAAGFPAGRLEVITNGAAVEWPSEPELAAVRQRFAVGSRPLVVGIGRLVAQKAWPTLVEAARHIRDADVLVAGDGPLRAELEATAAAAGDRVRFVGAVERPAALVGLARCVVSTSAWEGLPLALLEALTLGAPVVATAVDGVADVVPPDAALLVPPGDPAAVAAAVNRVLTEPGLAERLSRAARGASGAWALDTMLARYRERYAACVTAPS